jgi:archaellum component FlaC
MSKEKSTTIFTQTSNPISSWDALITDAEEMIGEAKAKIERLKQSIEIFRQLRDEGQPFPSERPKRRRRATF